MWQLHHVSLDVKTKFRVVFEGKKEGSGPTQGGLSLDDINISETTCPEFIWRVKNFTQVMENTPNNQSIFSPPFKSKEGYTFQMQLYPNGTDRYPGQLAAFAHLVAREGDTGQEWPCPWKQMTMMLMDQHPHIQKRMSNQRSVTTNPNMTATSGIAFPDKNENILRHGWIFLTVFCPLFTDSDQFFWDDPRKVGMEVKDTDGSTYFRGPGAGTTTYLTHLRAKSRDFIKGGDAIFLLTMEGNQIILKSIHAMYIYIYIFFFHIRSSSSVILKWYQSSRHPFVHVLVSCPSSDVSHLAVSQPLPSTTPDIPDGCQHECLNNGVCVLDEGKPTCRCVHITSVHGHK